MSLQITSASRTEQHADETAAAVSVIPAQRGRLNISSKLLILGKIVKEGNNVPD